jgi:hypothetical protein
MKTFVPNGPWCVPPGLHLPRQRVQRVVARRFSRARCDADRTVTAFAARLKDAVDLDSVRDDLAGVVRRTLEPAHLSYG